MIAALPWVQLAATLARNGLPNLAKRIKTEPAKAILDAATALAVPPTAEAVETAIASDPEAVAKLAEVDLQIFAVEEESRAAAREAWSGTWVMGFTAFFAMAVLTIFGGALYVLATGEVRNADLFSGQLKVLEYVLVAVVGFFFGSSVGSKRKGALDK